VARSFWPWLHGDFNFWQQNAAQNLLQRQKKKNEEEKNRTKNSPKAKRQFDTIISAEFEETVVHGK